MRKDLNTLEQIDRYLNGDMNIAEQSAFDIQLQQNDPLKRKVEHQKLIIQAAKRQILSNQINAAAIGGGFPFKNWLIGGGIIALLIGGIFLIPQTKNTELLTLKDTIQLVENSTDNQTIETEETVVEIDSNELVLVENNNVVPKSTNSVKPTQKITTQKSKPNEQTTEFYDFNGLQCWVKPNIQTFEIDATQTETIEGLEGTLIIIPENCFKDENGNTVTGIVDFELVEAYTLDDILLYNLTTTSNGSILETGGMFYTQATQNGKALTLDSKKPMLIQIPCVDEKPNMMAFESEIDTNGTINWKNPKPLEKWLTKVDMDALDFLPTGFEKEVYASMPIIGFEKANRKVVDSLYQLMAYENYFKSKGKDRHRMIGTRNKRSKAYIKLIDTIECGINPLSIKTIKNNAEYANSFLATKEFEERVKELHKLENGQSMFDVYLNNLDRNIWYSDSIVSVNLENINQSNTLNKSKIVKLTSSKKAGSNVFNTFYLNKKTKVKGGDLYADALTKYYSNKKMEYKSELEIIRVKGIREINKKLRQLKELKKSKNRLNISKNKLTNLNVTRGKNYTVQWASFGWANIDQYLHMLSKGSQDVEVSCEKSKPKGRLKMYQWLGSISTLTPIIVNKLKGVVKVPKPNTSDGRKMRETYTLAVSKENGKWFFGSKKYNPYKSNKVDIILKEVSLEKIKSILNNFSGASPLIVRLEKEFETLIYQPKKGKGTNSSLNNLKYICYKCLMDRTFLSSPQANGYSIYSRAYYIGKTKAIQDFINNNYKYPSLRKNTIAKFSFNVVAKIDKEGHVKVKSINSKAPLFFKIRLRKVLKSMPSWIPATEGNNVTNDEVFFSVKLPIH